MFHMEPRRHYPCVLDMSRSRRKYPIFANGTYGSDKQYKRLGRKALRRQQKVCDEQGREAPHGKEYGDPWGGAKDGKHWWAKATAQDMAK